MSEQSVAEVGNQDFTIASISDSCGWWRSGRRLLRSDADTASDGDITTFVVSPNNKGIRPPR